MSNQSIHKWRDEVHELRRTEAIEEVIRKSKRADRMLLALLISCMVAICLFCLLA